VSHDLKYRADIDGLRALAVLPVIFYHAGFAGFSGGFVGVDVFFVISGFLISGILLKQSREDKFSFSEFYFRRAKRLLPTLFTVLLFSLVFGYFLLMSGPYAQLFESTIWATAFASNFFFLENVNYFSQASEFMPLLHTWSLAVEEQFYLIWPPLILLFVWLERRQKTIFGLIILLAVIAISFALSVYYTQKNPSIAFYMTHLRLWELGLGALAAIAFTRFQNVKSNAIFIIAYLLGAIMILASITLLSSKDLFPGLAAVPVTLGTVAMLITGARSANYPASLFRLSPLVFIGKISYALYLWHWVIFAYARVYYNDVNLTLNVAMVCIGLTFAFSIATYYLIEQPFRYSSNRKIVWSVSTIGIAVFFVVGVFGMSQDGLPGRIQPDMSYAASQDAMREWPCDKRPFENLKGVTSSICVFGVPWNEADARLILWGDSHADHIAPVIEHAIKNQGVSVILWNGCAPFIDNKLVKRRSERGTAYSDRCGKLWQSMMGWMRNAYYPVDGIIVSTAFTGYPESLYSISTDERSFEGGLDLIKKGLTAFVDELPNNLPVLLLTDFPTPGGNPADCALRKAEGILRARSNNDCKDLEYDKMLAKYRPTIEMLDSFQANYTNITMINALEKWCGGKACPLYIKDRILYRDATHIRENLSTEEKDLIATTLDVKPFINTVLDYNLIRAGEGKTDGTDLLARKKVLTKSFWNDGGDNINERVPAASRPSIIFGDRSLTAFAAYNSLAFKLPDGETFSLEIDYRSRPAIKHIGVLRIKEKTSPDTILAEVYLSSKPAFFAKTKGQGQVTSANMNDDIISVTVEFTSTDVTKNEVIFQFMPAGAKTFETIDKSASGYFEILGLRLRKKMSK
jgi:peptidoglycan/LPS O-acetylase OafA/YrhL